jgi:hypothetical protein
MAVKGLQCSHMRTAEPTIWASDELKKIKVKNII